MKFITYTDVYDIEHYFDPTKASFTLSQPLGTLDEVGKPSDGFGTKVCLGEHTWIIAKEEPASIVRRILEALEDT